MLNKNNLKKIPADWKQTATLFPMKQTATLFPMIYLPSSKQLLKALG